MESLLVASKVICLPFCSEEHYEECMKDKGAFRQFITDMYTKYPEIFPHQMKEGFNFRGFTASSRKLDGFRMRRITLSDKKVYQIRPSFMMPYLTGRTDEVEKALFLCRFGVPLWALVYVFGRNEMYCKRSGGFS